MESKASASPDPDAKLSQTAMLPSNIIDSLPEIYTKIEDALQ